MHWVRWALLPLMAVACVAQAQPSDTGAAQPVLRDLRLSPSLRLHTRVDDNDMASFLIADKMETDEDGKVIMTGSAEVRRLDSVVKGDYIDYQRSDGQVRVRGNGLIMRDGNIVKAPSFDYNLNSETGEVEYPDFWFGVGGGSGSADQADIFSQQHMRLHGVTYAGCPCPEPSWYIRSPRVDLHFDENEGIARHGVLYFKDTPLLYSPWLSFPLRKERKSGFLIPTYGTSSKSGFDFSLPYYFNIAPNYDATLTPRYLGKRGLQLGGEFRYLGRRYSGIVQGTYLNNDKQTGYNRWLFGAQHTHRLGGGFTASFNVNRVSDDDYFRDFSNLGLNEATTNYLASTAGLSWSGYQYFSASLRATKYQTLQDRTSNYRRPQFDKLPELTVRGARYNWGGFDVISRNTATRFRMPFYSGREPEFDAFRDRRLTQDGKRFASYTTIAYPFVRPGWYVTPQAGIHLSQYSTDWYEHDLTRFAGRPKTQTRSVPIYSVDAGMTFERDTTLFGNPSLQTLEPRVYYLYVPYRYQDDLPIYDTSVATFNFAQAFDENLFTGGWDRIADANQLTVGLTTRWLDADSGFERLSISAAQRLYFQDQHVALNPNNPMRTGKKSDYLFGVNAAVTDTLSVRFDAQWNPETRDRNRMSAGFRWEPKRLATLSASYRYDRDPRAIDDPRYEIDPENDRSREQVSVAGQWPLTNKWYAMGRYDYSLQEKRSTQSILGVEYKGDCCWVARAVVQRYAVSKEDVNTAVFFQLELSGLGSLGTDPMSLLSDRIAGYRTITPPIPDQTTFERYE